MNNDILVLGKGFIGTRIAETINCQISQTKFYSFKEAQDEILKFKPKIIINCIGHTGRNVDECEKDIDKTLMANTFIPIMLAEVALRNNIKLVNISSGCIYHFDYSKDTPITEDRIPDFFELFYSRTKTYADRALEILSKRYPILILRIRVPLDNCPHPKNLLTKLISYRKAIDLPNSVTYIPDFISALKYLIKIDACGIYNVVAKTPLRYPQLLEVYRRYVKDFSYEVIDFKKLNLVRTNLVLSVEKLEKSGFKVRGIEEILEECVREYLINEGRKF